MKTSAFTSALKGLSALSFVFLLASCSKEYVEPASSSTEEVSARKVAQTYNEAQYSDPTIQRTPVADPNLRQVSLSDIRASKDVKDPGQSGISEQRLRNHQTICELHPKTQQPSTDQIFDDGRRLKDLTRSTR
jgi:hypothetical protein